VTAWVDYVDARRRLLHEWHEQGVSAEDMAVRIELWTEQIEAILAQPTEPPFPGSARFQLEEWKRRVAELEAELYAAGATPSNPPPVESQFRALKLHPDPECCGCQYWTDHPRPGQHHPQCEHAPRPAPSAPPKEG
jgi:hypothetical protein